MTRRKSKREPVPYDEVWWCETCGDGKADERTRVAMMQHLHEHHALPDQLKGSRTLELHLDLADRYVSTYKWRIGPHGAVRATQSVSGPRG